MYFKNIKKKPIKAVSSLTSTRFTHIHQCFRISRAHKKSVDKRNGEKEIQQNTQTPQTVSTRNRFAHNTSN